ncbi:MAG: hypothetical protein J6R77_03250 [Clostridia bacterium]|nr:hypothetical protein [Clostridia bacterium]
MRKQIACVLVGVCVLMSLLPLCVAAEPLTVEVPVTVAFADATGVDLNLRLNPHLVESATLVRPADSLANTSYTAHQNGDKVKVAIASTTPISNEGVLLYLQLTLKVEAGAEDELCKLLQVKVNERIAWQADNCVLLAGVQDGGHYSEDVTVWFNEGTATLNGAPFASGSTVTKSGNYQLVVTDLTGKTRVVHFTVEKPGDMRLGDVDGDGGITSTDARLVLQYYAGKVGESNLNLAVADVDSDGGITSTDARLILQKYAGKIRDWP